MAGITIQEFFVKLGFQTDPASSKRFHDTMQNGIRGVKEFRLALIGLAIGAEEAIRRTMNSFNNMYLLSKSTGVPVAALKSFEFGLKAVGIQSEQTAQIVSKLAETLRKPGKMEQWQGLLNTVGDTKPILNAQDAYVRLATALDKARRNGGEATIQYQMLKNTIEKGDLGIDLDPIRNLSLNLKDYNDQIKFHNDLMVKMKLNQEQAADAGHKLSMTWDRIVDIFSSGIDKIVSDNFENIKKILDAIGDWLTDPEVIDGFKHIFDEMRKFFEDKDNRAKFIEDLKLVGEAIKGIVWVVGKLIEGFKWLKDIVGPEWAVAIAAVLFMFGPAIAGALISGLLGALSAAALAPIGLAVAGAIASAVGGYLIGDALRKAIESTEIGKLIMDMIARAITAPFLPTKTGVQISPEMAKRIEDARRKGLIKDRGPGTGNVENPYSDYDTPQYQHGGIVNANLHDGEMVLPRNISEGLQRMFGPHPDNLLESGDPGLSFKDFFEEVQRWWSGDASFRPIVDLADRFYERMSELLINVLDQTLKAMGYKDGIYGAAGTTGASPGAAPAPGGPTPGTPGTPGSPTGTPGGGVEFPPDWKPPEGTQTTSSGMEISHPERNNPGNLRVGGGDWLGKNTRPGQAFESFDTMAHGIRARIITYNSYFKRGLDTIAKIAEASGPGFENNMKAQLEAYKTAMGGDYNKPGGENLPIQLTPENLRKLTIAGISFEHGGKGVKLPKGAGEKEINEEMLKLMEEQKASGGTGVPGGPGDPNAVYGERITPQLKALLAKVAADQGVKFGVHSGIRQPGGSGRHDPRGGMGAADTYIYDQKTGRMLNPTDPNDFARLGQIAEEAYRLGAKGIGAGEGYMGGRSLHIGGTGYSPTGTAYWGTGEHEAGAMPWLKEAYRRSQQRQVAAATKKVAETAKKATDAATGRDRTGPLVEGGKTYPEGVMSPSELEQWHNAQQKVSEVTGTKLGGGAGGGTSGNRQVAMNTTNNYYINGAGDPHHTQKLIDESHKRRGHEEQRNSRAFLA